MIVLMRQDLLNFYRDCSLLPLKQNDKSNSDLQVLYTNCDQLLNKFDELSTIANDTKPDLILLTEVIPKAQTLPIGISRISIPGFL